MRVRLQDVAKRASVSMQTVSRFMRTPHLVSPETAARVQEAMEALDYVKNEQATALRLGRTRTIGLLLPLLVAPFWSEVAAGAEARAHEQGYTLLLCDTSDAPTKEEDYIALLLGYQVAGIIYAHPRCRVGAHPAYTTLVQSDTPVIVVSVLSDDLPYPHVHTDDRRAGYVAIRHLLDLGRERIALVMNTDPPSFERMRGAHDALYEANLVKEASSVVLVPGGYEGGFVAGEQIASAGGPLPDAVFCTTDTISFGLLEALQSNGVHIPEDIAIASHDGLTASAFVTPSLTTIAPRAREMGATCVDKLLCTKEEREKNAVYMVEADLIVRASTAGRERIPYQGLTTPISDAEAWSRWRTQMRPFAQKSTPITSISLEQVINSSGDFNYSYQLRK